MCSDESHFNISLIVRDKVTRQSPQTTTFLKSRKGEPKRNRAEILTLLRERERVSLCRVSLFLCSVGVDYTTAPTPAPPPPPHTHIAHPPSAAWTAWLTFPLLPPPPPPTPPPPPPPQHTQTSLGLPELCWLHDCLACVCAAPNCVDILEDCSIYFWEPLHRRCQRDVIFSQQQRQGLWLGCQYGLRWQRSDPGVPSTHTTAAKSTATQKFPMKRIQRLGRFLIVIGWVVSSLVWCSVGDLFMIWVSGCITVAGLVLGETEGRNYDVLLGPVKKRLFLTRLPAYVYFELWVETDPVSKQNTMPDSFLKQWSSTSKQIWFQAAVDACATTQTGPSTAPEMANLFQRTSVPFYAPMWCTHLQSWEGTIWTALTAGQTLECQALTQLLRNPQPRRNSRWNGYRDLVGF